MSCWLSHCNYYHYPNVGKWWARQDSNLLTWLVSHWKHLIYFYHKTAQDIPLCFFLLWLL